MLGIDFREWLFDTLFGDESEIRVSVHNMPPVETGLGQVEGFNVPPGLWEIDVEENLVVLPIELEFGPAFTDMTLTHFGLWWEHPDLGLLWVAGERLQEQVDILGGQPLVIEAGMVQIRASTLTEALAAMEEAS